MISKLSAKYQFCAIHTTDNTDGKVTKILEMVFSTCHSTGIHCAHMRSGRSNVNSVNAGP